MKIECTKDKLVSTITSAERITGKRLALNILSKVIIEAKEKKLIIKSTNLDLGLEMTIASKVSGEGIIAISGGLLSNYLSSLSGETVVSLELVGNNIVVSSGGSSAIIRTEDSKEFPAIPRIKSGEKAVEYSIKATDFVMGLVGVAYAASSSDVKPETSGVYIYPEGEQLVFVATDVFRLAEKRIEISAKSAKELEDAPAIIIPIKNVMEIIRMFDGSEESLDISYTSNQLSIKSSNENGDIYLLSRLIDGKFPNYKEILPKSFNTQVVVLKNDLANALKISNIFADKFHKVGIKVDTEEGLLELSTKNQDTGETTTTLDGTLEGVALDINLNARYLMDALSSVHRDSIMLGLNGGDKAVLLRGVGDRSFLYLVMPIRK